MRRLILGTDMSIRAILAASVLVSGFSSAAMAVPLPFTSPPFTQTALPGTTLDARPELAGIVLEDRLTPYLVTSGGQQASGSILARVVRETASGTLDFYWQVRGDEMGASPVTIFRVDGFTTYVSDGDWRIDSSGNEGPETAYNFGTGAVNFGFDRGIASDDYSYLFFLRTSATSYAETGRYDIITGAGFSGLFSTFAPSTTVPEPAQWALMLGGLALVGGIARRRRAGSTALYA
ncbi:PEPxxWA-CTERM sorting domain-containing protein [Sphingosinicellaceae bacterium]|nr:PEPxxWA-CTERM sorting domain-containing protein [Sphingosinicellaceae bacterium]